MNTVSKTLALLALGALAVSGAPAQAQDSTLLGAGAGAGGGAGIGFALGGPVGAVVGGLVGAGVGAGSGHLIGKEDKKNTAAPATGNPYGTPRGGSDLTAQVQSELNAAGYDAGPPDGRMGPRTSNAIRAYQYNNGLPQDGQPSVALLDQMRAKRGAAPAQPAAYTPAPPPPAYQPAPVAPAAAGASTAPGLPALPGAQQPQAATAGANCKPYQSRMTVDGKETVRTGTACLQADGTWKPIN